MTKDNFGSPEIITTHHCDPFDHLDQEKFEQKRLYKTIVIDPPWEISLTGMTKRRPNRRKELPYKTMTLEQIKEFPISEFAQTGCHVYLWTTNKMIQHTWDIFKSCGVNYHLVLPWIKPSGIAPCFAYKFASEFCVLGFFGKPMQKFISGGILNWIKANPERDNHSAKPTEFYELIRTMSPEPRIDIFARKRHFGFDAWGDQVENMLQVSLN